MKKKFLVFALIAMVTTNVFAAGIWSPKDTLNTPLTGYTFEGVQFWNGGGLMFEMQNVTIKVTTMYSSAGMFASEKNSTSWIVYIVEGTMNGKRCKRNVIDSEATSIVFW